MSSNVSQGSPTWDEILHELSGPVAAGAKLLDTVHPGWRAKVDPDTLDMAWFAHCVLGQLYGTYGKGLSAIGYPNPEEHGFYTTSRPYDALTKLWLEEIARGAGVDTAPVAG